MFETVADDRFAIVEDLLVSSGPLQDERNVQFTVLTDGNLIATWSDADGVRAQLFDDNGHRVDDEFLLVPGSGGASIAALPSGGFIVTFDVENDYPANVDVQVQIFDNGGQPIGTAFPVNSTTDGFQSSSTVTVLASGEFVVTWENRDSGGPTYDDIRAQRFAADGTPIGGEIIVTDSKPGDKIDPTIAPLAGGGFVVSWFEWGAEVADQWGNLSPGSRAQVFDASGNKVGAAFALNSFIPGNQSSPTISALPSGGFVAAWADNGLDPLNNDTGHRGIWLQIFDASGNRVGTEIHASGLGPYGQDQPLIEIIPGTGFLVMWKDSNATDEAEAGHLRAQLFDFSGNRIGGEFAVDPALGGGQNPTDAATLPNGAVIIGWTNFAPVMGDWGDSVRARMLFPVQHGTESSDSLVGGDDRDFFMGHGGNDSISGGAEDDGIGGGDGNDLLNGGAGRDSLYGEAGNDTLDGGSGSDQLFGGLGDDIFIIDNVGDVVTEASDEGIDLVKTTLAYVLGANVENLTLTGIAAVSGTGNVMANTIRGNEAANVLAGLEGADKLYGNGGNDTLDGGIGDDYLYGGLGNDMLTGGLGYDRMYGGVGDDTYYANDADDYAYENAGEGHDMVVASLDHQLRAEVEDLLLTGGALIGKGNASDNGITGNANANRLYGYEGNDTLNGMGGDDYLLGAEGNDTLNGGAGYDRMYGGVGNDTYIVTDASDYAYENAGEGNDRVVASINHSLRDNVEELELAGTADLRGYGNGLDNLILGNSGANLLYGRDGQDSLFGNSGNDILYGENGNDHLNGGAGMDRFYGGTGADEFIFGAGDFSGMTSSTADRIHDFAHAEGDIIRLDGVDANGVAAGDQGFAFIGSGGFTGTAGELRTQQISGNTYVMGDTNGDGQADFWIRLDGLQALGQSDFML